MAKLRFPTLRQRLRLARLEDRAFDDITTQRTIPRGQRASAQLVAKQAGILAGIDVFKTTFHLVDKTIEITAHAGNGDPVKPREVVAELWGPMQGILRAERLALNLLAHLSGVATLTHQCVKAAEGTETTILDTRKTTPLWRDLERDAVRAGGGGSHRSDLADMILVKDNHIDVNGGMIPTLERIFRPSLRGVGATHASPARTRTHKAVIVEARTLPQVEDALRFPIDVILLDNMTHDQVRRAIKVVAGRAQVEVSGGLGPKDIRTLARAGVDRISIGRLTHSAPALDFSLRIAPQQPPTH